jgi:hypothetical protein
VAARGYAAAHALDPDPATLEALATTLLELGDKDAAAALFADGDHGVGAATREAVARATNLEPELAFDAPPADRDGRVRLARARHGLVKKGGALFTVARNALLFGSTRQTEPRPVFSGGDVLLLEADTGVALFDAAAGRVTRRFAVSEALGVAATDALVAVGLPGRVAIFERRSGERLQTLRGEPFGFALVAIEGDFVAAATSDGHVAVWRRSTAELLWKQQLSLHWIDKVTALAISEGSLLVSVGPSHRLLALETGAARALGKACKAGLLVAATTPGYVLHPRDAYMTSGTAVPIVRCDKASGYRGVAVGKPTQWDVSALLPGGKLVLTSYGAVDPATDAIAWEGSLYPTAFSADVTRVLSEERNDQVVRDTATGAELGRFTLAGAAPDTLHFVEHNGVAAVANDAKLWLWGPEGALPAPEKIDFPYQLEVSGSEKRPLVAAGEAVPDVWSVEQAALWKLVPGACPLTERPWLGGQKGDRLLCIPKEAGTRRHTVDGHDHRAFHADLSPDGTRILFSTGEAIEVVDIDSDAVVTHVASEGRGSWLDARRFLVKTDERIEVYRASGKRVDVLDFTLRGRVVARCASRPLVVLQLDDDGVHILDAEARTLRHHRVPGRVEGISADCRLLWIVRSTELVLWSWGDDSEVATIQSLAGELFVRTPRGLVDATGDPALLLGARMSLDGRAQAIPWEAIAPRVQRPGLVAKLLTGAPVIDVE